MSERSAGRMSEERVIGFEELAGQLQDGVKDYTMEDIEKRAVVIGIRNEENIQWTAVGKAGLVLLTLIRGIAGMFTAKAGTTGDPVRAAKLFGKELVKEVRKGLEEKEGT